MKVGEYTQVYESIREYTRVYEAAGACTRCNIQVSTVVHPVQGARRSPALNVSNLTQRMAPEKSQPGNLMADAA